jgi:bifunctional DNA-binding transcriptional regulator/antitoxin component of YhaV-PrlF toxin-antitoxin module
MANLTVQVDKIAHGAGIILPQEVLDALGVATGESLYLVRTARGYELTRDDPSLADAMAGFREIRGKHRHAFRDLS